MVSTPQVLKGSKRKSTVDSSKDKGNKKKNKRGEATSTTTIERNELYFDEDKLQERYNIDFFLRKVFNGRWVDYNFFDSHNFELSMKLGTLG